jgi:hypothetical protein
MYKPYVGASASHNELEVWNQVISFEKIVYAVGPSGRGRSFVGKNQAAAEVGTMNEIEMFTTVYLGTRQLDKELWNWTHENASALLIEWIQDSLHELHVTFNIVQQGNTS